MTASHNSPDSEPQNADIESSDSSLTQQQKKKLTAHKTGLLSSRMSWRIAVIVFVTTVLVQSCLTLINLKPYEISKHEEFRYKQTKFLSALFDIEPDGQSLISTAELNQIKTEKAILGLAIYNANFQKIQDIKAPPSLVVSGAHAIHQTILRPKDQLYEFVLKPTDINNLPYYIAVKLNILDSNLEVQKYIQKNILMILGVSSIVTFVLMMALSHWLLKPILFLKENLRLATLNPETPKMYRSPYDPKDDLGDAIAMAQDLIKQNAKNIRQMKNSTQSQIHKLAYYDSLTGLPNRILFTQKLTDHLKGKTGYLVDGITRFAVIAMDMDHFKDINDSMGHVVGDELLKAVATRLQQDMPQEAFVARIGEDEFAVTTPLLNDSMTARHVGEMVQNSIKSKPFRVFDENFQLSVSIGVAVFPDDGANPDQVLKNADIALNRAKEDGRDCIREYLEDFDKAVQARFQMLRDLRDALEQKHLMLYYQPQIDLKSGKIIGAEALLRWFKKDNSEKGGRFISPADFIPVAEQSGLIVPIGEWVMKEACRTARAWHDMGFPIRIAVNVSGVQFHQADVVEHTKSVLAQTGLHPHYLELEVTESAFMNDIQATIETLKKLNSLGVELAIDDFGTGYSSLSYLRQFPIDRLKIDQSFIRSADTNMDDRAITKTIIGLAHSLNLKVIAEGVETRIHEEFLAAEGCDECQGYRYSKPIPPEQFVELLRSYTGSLTFFDQSST
jgi:diguanylate cyclase (GGDEF)-like protein